jgi:triphosphoribosyl-dephospho-CoA synthase
LLKIFESENQQMTDRFEKNWQALDKWMREEGHRRNPGTTADLIAAGLFVLLCCQQ